MEQVTSSWSIFFNYQDDARSNKHKINCILNEGTNHDVLGNQLVYTQRTSAQSIYSRVRLHVSTIGYIIPNKESRSTPTPTVKRQQYIRGVHPL